jgi:[ribosomal protein S18]-alanine N-acetyltransferase
MDGRVIGYGGIWVILDEAHLTNSGGRDQQYRCLGIASRLLGALIDKSVAMGARRMSLEVRPSNQPARGALPQIRVRCEGAAQTLLFQ